MQYWVLYEVYSRGDFWEHFPKKSNGYFREYFFILDHSLLSTSSIKYLLHIPLCTLALISVTQVLWFATRPKMAVSGVILPKEVDIRAWSIIQWKFSEHLIRSSLEHRPLVLRRDSCSWRRDRRDRTTLESLGTCWPAERSCARWCPTGNTRSTWTVKVKGLGVVNKF